ncbi:MAG: hypothetical protein ACSLFK_13080 [Gemmatimonadaceae bacterium]
MQINDEVGAARRAMLLKEISARLKPVCVHYHEEDFATLVAKMADRQLAAEARLRDQAQFRARA